MGKRNGYEVVPGDRWLFCGPRRDFDQPEEVEIKDVQRGQVRVRFVDGKLAGKLEWHKPGLLFAPIANVDEVNARLEHQGQIDDQALSGIESSAVLTVGSAFGEEILHDNWKWGSDLERVAELLEVPLQKLVKAPLVEKCRDRSGLWHTPGRYALHLARRLAERYPLIVHDEATIELDRYQLRWAGRQWDDPYREQVPLPGYFRNSYLLVCSWCHIAPDCDRLDTLHRQRQEIDWLYQELRRVINRFGDYAPQAKWHAVARVREHYGLEKQKPLPESPPPGVNGDRAESNYQ